MYYNLHNLINLKKLEVIMTDKIKEEFSVVEAVSGMKVKMHDGDSDIDEMKGSLEFLKPELKSNFVRRHLCGRARLEITSYSTDIKNNHDTIFDALETCFSIKENEQQLLRRIMSRTQRKTENINDFKHELLKITRKIRNKDEKEIIKLLKECFIEGVGNSKLKWELTHQVDTHFTGLREIAREWERSAVDEEIYEMQNIYI